MSRPEWGLKQLSTGGAAWAGIRYQAADAPLSRPARLSARAADRPVMVEPYPGLYSRLRELMENLRDRLWEHYLLDDTIDAHITELVELLETLERASNEALAGQSGGAAGRSLSNYAGVLRHFLGDEESRAPGQLSCVLVSDVAYEDIDTGRVLQNAVGTPDVIYVRGDDGTVYAGAVHSFFEMELGSREEMERTGWPTVLRACPVVRPYWTSGLIVP